MNTLQIVWFILLTVLVIGFTVLSGADLGVGILRFFARNEDDQRAMLSAIGPFWDGNEVWLLAAGGASFAAFPPVYAAIFSGLYLPLMVALFALIIRAISIEFGSREQSQPARGYWGIAWAVTSTLATLLLGMALGNILRGLPLNAGGEYTGSFFGLLNPFAWLLGALNLAMLTSHGAFYLAMRAEGDLRARASRWALISWAFYLPLTVFTLFAATRYLHLARNYTGAPGWWLVPALGLLAVIFAGLWTSWQAPTAAFVASCFSVTLLLASAAIALFPLLVPALNNPALSLTAANASSTPLTLFVMLIAVIIGLPLVAIYTIWVYKVFGGKITKAGHY